ncbi:MAG TPA: hypothetical protein DCF33_01860 [Saprospirales bacterium]|nr:hypothetical protein [Saprospirales bacterium]
MPLSNWKELATEMPDWVSMEKQAANLAAAILILMDNLLAVLTEGPERTRLYNTRKAFFQDRRLPSSFLLHIPDGEELFSQIKAWEALQKARNAALVQFGQAILTG